MSFLFFVAGHLISHQLVHEAAKAKASDSCIAYLTGTKPDQPYFTISEVAVDQQEPMVLQRYYSRPLHALTNNWTRDSSYRTHHCPNQPHLALTP